MFATPTSYTETKSVESYAEALRVFERAQLTPKGHRRVEYDGYPLGSNTKKDSPTRVRQTRDKSIVFRLYSTDVVMWHPDNSFALEPYETMTTGMFCSHFSPVRVGASGTATYFPAIGTDNEYTDWSERWRQARVCRASGTFRQDKTGAWIPDEDTLPSFEYMVVDRAVTKAIRDHYPIKDFLTWLSMVPLHTTVVHETSSIGRVVEALERRDFRAAAISLPAVEVPRGFGLAERMRPYALRGVRGGMMVTPASVDRVLRWLYHDGGAVRLASCKTMTRDEYAKRCKEISAYKRSDVYCRGGWQ